jgi:hypothetical protein
MEKILRVKVSGEYKLDIEFTDGASGTIDLSSRLFGPVFEPLRDPVLFAKVQLDAYGAVCWPNGADLAPDALYRSIVSNQGSRSVLAS